MSARNRIRDTLIGVAMKPRNMAKALSRLMPGASQTATVMVLDGQWLKLIHVVGRQVTRVLALPVQNASPEEILQTFTEASEAEALNLSEVIVANPTHLSTVRIFSLPSTEPKEIRDIVDLQAEKHTPYAKDEILSDFSIIERSKGGYSRVMLVISHQDVIQRSVRLVESSQLLLDRVGCELEGLIHWYRQARKEAGPGRSLIIDVDGNTTTLLVMQGKHPVFSRNVSTGTHHLEGNPAEASQRLISEVQRSIETLEAEGSAQRLQEVLLTGRLDRLNDLKAAIEKALQLPVSLVEPWQGITPTEELKKTITKLPALSYAGLAGMVQAKGEIELTPHTLRLRQAFEARGRALVLFGCQCVAALILASGLIIGRVNKQYRYYEQLRKVHVDTRPESQYVETALGHMDFVDKRLALRGDFLDLVDTLAQLTLPEIQWNALTYTKDDTLLIKGTSEKLPKVYEFVAALESLPLFEEVSARRVARRTVEARDVTDFEVRCAFAAREQGG